MTKGLFTMFRTFTQSLQAPSALPQRYFFEVGKKAKELIDADNGRVQAYQEQIEIINTDYSKHHQEQIKIINTDCSRDHERQIQATGARHTYAFIDDILHFYSGAISMMRHYREINEASLQRFSKITTEVALKKQSEGFKEKVKLHISNGNRTFEGICTQLAKQYSQKLEDELNTTLGRFIKEKIWLNQMVERHNQNIVNVLLGLAMFFAFFMLLYKSLELDQKSLKQDVDDSMQRLDDLEAKADNLLKAPIKDSAEKASQSTVVSTSNTDKPPEKSRGYLFFDPKPLQEKVARIEEKQDQLKEKQDQQRIEFLDMRIKQNWSDTPVIGWFLPDTQYKADKQERAALIQTQSFKRA